MAENNIISGVDINPNMAMTWFLSNQHLILQMLFNIGSAVLVLLIGNWIVKKIALYIGILLKKRKFDQTVVEFIESMLRYVMLTMVIIAALGRLGVETTSVVAIIGAAGLAIGLALQGSLSNLAAGVLIVTFRPFKSGDFVEVGGVSGAVASIQFFSTVLTTPDNKMVVVPNGTVISTPITNYSHHDTRRVDHVVGVSYSSDLQKTKQALMRAVCADPRVLKDPEPVVGVQALADSSVNFVVRPWVKTDDYWGVYFELLQAIKEELDKEGIVIPYPQMDVHHHKVFDENFEIGMKNIA